MVYRFLCVVWPRRSHISSPTRYQPAHWKMTLEYDLSFFTNSEICHIRFNEIGAGVISIHMHHVK